MTKKPAKGNRMRKKIYSQSANKFYNLWRAVELNCQGYSAKRIASELGCTRSYVYYLLQLARTIIKTF